MQVDHAADVKKYAPDADAKHIAAIIKHLGIAMKSADAQMVSCSSKDELARVREQWCKKKLGLAQPDADLDKMIQAVCTTMKGDKTKSRVAFYYLLAKNANLLAKLG
ncbi:MAG: hypothetical protein RL291_1753 [Pseudomonadota bacterium]|jgi:phage host-nuclease inhibitor protein Gam